MPCIYLVEGVGSAAAERRIPCQVPEGPQKLRPGPLMGTVDALGSQQVVPESTLCAYPALGRLAPRRQFQSLHAEWFACGVLEIERAGGLDSHLALGTVERRILNPRSA